MRVPTMWSIRQRLIAAVLSLFVVMTVAACATADEPKAGTTKSATLATGFAVETLDPLKDGFWGNEFGYGELLMRPIADGSPQPWVLEKLDAKGDDTWVLTIQPKAKFQNGKALDGKALAAVMKYQLDNVSGLKPLAGTEITATGEREVTMKTPQPMPNMPFILADEAKFLVFDVEAYEASKGDGAKMLAAKFYTGPYVVEKLDAQGMQMKADPKYWGGTPPLESVSLKFIEDAQARILAVQNGEADFALYPPTDSAKSINGKNAHWISGKPKGPTFQLQLNGKTGPLVDPLVRKAFLAAIDYKELADDVMSGNYEPADGMYSPKAPYHKAMFKTDPKIVTESLQKAGYVKDSAGKWAKDGAPLELTVLTYPQQPDSGTLAVAVQSQVAKAGISMQIQQVPDINAVISTDQKWDGAVVGNGTTSFSGDPITPLQSYFASSGPRNHFGINDPALDELITKLASTMKEKDRFAILEEIQTIVADKAYMGFLGMRKPGVVVSPAWKSYKMPTANLWIDARTKP